MNDSVPGMFSQEPLGFLSYNSFLEIARLMQVRDRLLRDSHLDLKIETLKENSHLILDLNSQFYSENSHSHLSKFFLFSFSTLNFSLSKFRDF